MDNSSFLSEMAAERDRIAANLKRFCPTWSGDSFPTWRDYPTLTDDAPPEAVRARAVVILLDSLLSQPALKEEFIHWNKLLAVLQEWDEKHRLIRRLTVDRTKPARAAKAARAAKRRTERQQLAKQALTQASGDAGRAAVLIGKSKKTLNRWLSGE